MGTHEHNDGQMKFSYEFKPVGQGLFSIGCIRADDDTPPKFLWVYDCGTASSPILVQSGIDALQEEALGRNRIDLLTLSHFDNDHISGVCELLRRFEIGTLVLPYAPLDQRLVALFQGNDGAANDPVVAFHLNPIAYLLDQEGPGIDHILFVPPSGDEGPPYSEEALGPQDTPQEAHPQIAFESLGTEGNLDMASLVNTATPSDRTTVEFLRPGSSINVPTCAWEFIPYNADPSIPLTEYFSDQVDMLRRNLLEGQTDGSRGDALNQLKNAYDFHFGSSSKRRNAISLFLYAGPIYSSWKDCQLLTVQSDLPNSPARWKGWAIAMLYYCNLQGQFAPASSGRCGIIYSGDGYLDTIERTQRLIDYLDKQRVKKNAIFQVMHHGASDNWHKGVASALTPLASVFSSDPNRSQSGHPHASVLRDFWNFGAVQVDKERGFTADGVLVQQLPH